MLSTKYQEFIALSRYARWDESQQRRETWDETVDRYFGFFTTHLLENHGVHLTKPEYTELSSGVKDLAILPSMRCLMTAGPALGRDHIAGYNPVVGSTRVLTYEYGMVPIAELEGENATVLNKNGDWTDASFRSYGEQPTFTVNLKLNSNTLNSVDCTANHRWVLEDGRVLSTEALREGDRISFVASPRPSTEDKDYKLGVIHGLVYGDGTAVKACGRVKGFHIRLCSDSEDLLPWFDGYPVCYPPSANGDPVVMMYDGFAATHDLKQLPSINETDSYLVGFVRGWMAADGYVSRASQVSICVNTDGKSWLSRVSSKLGFVVQKIKQQKSETNYGKRKHSSWVVFLSRSSLISEDFIIQRKRENFKPLKSHFVVSSILPTNRVEEVYCAEVPDTNTFVLDMGLVTGNCAYRPVDDLRAFDEILFVLMCATGVGFSVERQYVNQLPALPECLEESGLTITVRDSKRGWTEGYRELLSLLYAGRIPKWDMSKLRPAGARLKTMGGRSSGPEPLIELFNYTVRLIKHAIDEGQRKLTSVQCHDIVCKIGECVVVGGVRRSALLSLSNLSDQRMRDAKTGEWWLLDPQRSISNNSVAYTETPEVGQFMEEWMHLYKSKSGERGIFNREAAREQAMKSGRRKGYLGNGAEPTPIDFGTNPCSEIILRPKQFCNLSTIVVRPEDNANTLEEKVRLAAILGTWQSTLTNFRYLTRQWKTNCEEERLLGVSMTGIMTNKLLNGQCSTLYFTGELLEHLKDIAVLTNREWAERLDIPQSTAVTCVKPEGTASQLVNTTSGIHPAYAEHFVRRVRQGVKDPLTQLMIDQGVPNEPDEMNKENIVFSFPMKTPEGTVLRNDMSATQQLEHWTVFQDHWCEHKPSITVYVREKEWPTVGGWVWENFDAMSGVAFLPHSDHIYKQAPYEEISADQYTDMLGTMPEMDWGALSDYETEDSTTGHRELACVAGACEI